MVILGDIELRRLGWSFRGVTPYLPLGHGKITLGLSLTSILFDSIIDILFFDSDYFDSILKNCPNRIFYMFSTIFVDGILRFKCNSKTNISDFFLQPTTMYIVRMTIDVLYIENK